MGFWSLNCKIVKVLMATCPLMLLMRSKYQGPPPCPAHAASFLMKVCDGRKRRNTFGSTQKRENRQARERLMKENS